MNKYKGKLTKNSNGFKIEVECACGSITSWNDNEIKEALNGHTYQRIDDDYLNDILSSGGEVEIVKGILLQPAQCNIPIWKDPIDKIYKIK